MKNSGHEICLRSFDLASYLTGAAQGAPKAMIEQHLCECERCFTSFISAFNEHLDHDEIMLKRGSNPVSAFQFV